MTPISESIGTMWGGLMEVQEGVYRVMLVLVQIIVIMKCKIPNLPVFLILEQDVKRRKGGRKSMDNVIIIQETDLAESFPLTLILMNGNALNRKDCL